MGWDSLPRTAQNIKWTKSVLGHNTADVIWVELTRSIPSCYLSFWRIWRHSSWPRVSVQPNFCSVLHYSITLVCSLLSDVCTSCGAVLTWEGCHLSSLMLTIAPPPTMPSIIPPSQNIWDHESEVRTVQFAERGEERAGLKGGGVCSPSHIAMPQGQVTPGTWSCADLLIWRIWRYLDMICWNVGGGKLSAIILPQWTTWWYVHQPISSSVG